MNEQLATQKDAHGPGNPGDPGTPANRKGGRGSRFTYSSGSQPLEGFTIKRGIGIGGFGEVYFALSDAGKEVAIKRIQRNLDVELRGVRQCLNLKHVNLIALWDIRTNDLGESWVVMEYVPGYNLREKLERHPEGMPSDELRQWFLSMCAGVNYLHKHGIVHRDLKPGNIFFDTDQHIVKIGDYGLSKFISSSKRSGQTESVGTFHYMAPEIGKGIYGREIDIYALGVILYEMLSGRLPFDGESAHEIIMKHMTANVDLSPIPAPFRMGVEGALRKDPQQRISTVQELIAALPWPEAEVIRVVGPFAPPAPLPEPASVSRKPQEDVSFLPPDPRSASQTMLYIGEDGCEEVALYPVSASRTTIAGRDLLADGIVLSQGQERFVPREPIARALSGGLDGAIRWWNRSDISVPVKVLVAVVLSVVLILNSSWLLIVALSLAVVYAGYYLMRRLVVGDRDPHQLEETRAASRERHDKNVRYYLSQRSLSDRLTDLSSSLLVAACSTAVFSFVALAVKSGDWNFSVESAAVYAWLTITATLASWIILIANKCWEHRKGDLWLRRLTMMIGGFGLGVVSYALRESFFVQQFVESASGASGANPPENALVRFVMFFTIWFAVSQSWRVVNPSRTSRLTLWRVAIGLTLGVVLAQALGLNLAWFSMIIVITSVASQLAAPLITFDEAVARAHFSKT